ncbi:MAG TPA: hypothetical protein VL994_02815 [Steroidobacteraceae bacterium]|nr:hypothetical protein [Steroidobacteraceae bacterium]
MTDPMPSMSAEAPHVDQSLITYTNVVYALHALSVLIGLSTAHTIIFSFVGSLPSIIAVIMNYARRSATVGTFLESHFRWQIRTFWFAALWALAIIVSFITIIGIPFGFIGMIAMGIWVIYRVARGWLALKDRRPMYV